MEKAVNLRIIKNVMLFFIIFLFSITLSYSNDTTNTVKLDVIEVNGEPLQDQELSDIVIAQSDSIIFHYHCESKSGIATPFRFNLNIKNSDNYSTQGTNSKSALYTKLPEDDYVLKISAFSSTDQWRSNSTTVKFRVDNREAALIKRNKALLEKLNKLKLTDDSKPSGFAFEYFSVAIGLLFGTIIAFIIAWIVFKRKKDVDKYETIRETAIMSEEKNISEEDYQKVISENGNLRAEVAALRGQIDALQKRGEELSAQNKELQQKIELLSNSKSEIEELQKQKDELFALIIHDIKNPVALIKNLVELLRSYDLTAIEQHEIIDDIFTTTSRIVSLSQEVSKILALESSTLTINPENVNMNDILSDIAHRYEKAAKEKDIMIHFKRNDKVSGCEIDPIKIDDVVDNLVSNAIKFSYPGSKVKLSAREENGTIVVDISDKGQGLSEEDIQKAFKRGAMLSARPTGNEHSSGLGLWIVKRLIEVHKGRVWIKSAVGKGSTFSFSVPIKQEE